MVDIAAERHKQELQESWQGRVLAGTQCNPIVMSVLAHNFEDAIVTLCAATIPDFDGSMPAPHLTTAAKIDHSGAVVADVVQKNGEIVKDEILFASELDLRNTFRRLADRMKLSDSDRIEMFKCVQRWVVADRRLDPTFDPKDPDAKRLVH